jgi:hypothetical protein
LVEARPKFAGTCKLGDFRCDNLVSIGRDECGVAVERRSERLTSESSRSRNAEIAISGADPNRFAERSTNLRNASTPIEVRAAIAAMARSKRTSSVSKRSAGVSKRSAGGSACTRSATVDGAFGLGDCVVPKLNSLIDRVKQPPGPSKTTGIGMVLVTRSGWAAERLERTPGQATP